MGEHLVQGQYFPRNKDDCLLRCMKPVLESSRNHSIEVIAFLERYITSTRDEHAHSLLKVHLQLLLLQMRELCPRMHLEGTPTYKGKCQDQVNKFILVVSFRWTSFHSVLNIETFTCPRILQFLLAPAVDCMRIMVPALWNSQSYNFLRVPGWTLVDVVAQQFRLLFTSLGQSLMIQQTVQVFEHIAKADDFSAFKEPWEDISISSLLYKFLIEHCIPIKITLSWIELRVHKHPKNHVKLSLSPGASMLRS